MWQIDMNDLNINTSCFDSILEVMLKSFGYEYPLLNLKKFSPNHFTFNDNGEGFITRGNQNIDVLRELFSINTEFISRSDIVDIHEIIKYNMKYAPVGVFVDAFECKWTNFYKKGRIKHFILIVDLDEIGKIYKCIDIYYPTVGTIYITYNELNKLYKKIVSFKLSPPKNNYNDILIYLKNHIYIPDKMMFNTEKDNMINYLTSLTAEKIGSVETINYSLLLLKLKWIAEDKMNFMRGLQYYDSKLNKPMFNTVYNELEAVAGKVNLLKSALIKYVVTGNLNTEKTKYYIESIYNINYQISVKMDRIAAKG